MEKQVPEALSRMQSVISFNDVFSCCNDLSPLGDELLKVKQNLDKGLSLKQAFSFFPKTSASLSALERLITHYYYFGSVDFGKTAERLRLLEKTFSESRTQLETLKYSLFGGVLLSSILLGVMQFFAAGLTENEMITVVRWGTSAYLLAFSLLASFFVSRIELRKDFFIVYALFLVVVTQVLFLFFSVGGV
ncbi:MAG: hypothetical protein ABH803_03350 [Candidatus Micrarchaeota archaeon]